MSERAVVSGVRRYEAKATVESGGRTTTITTDLRIEAAGPITLTQLEASAGRPGYLYVPPTSNLTVLGDVVTIEGPLKLPGRLVKIMARRIEAAPQAGSSDNPVAGRPAIIVDGAELDRDTREPKPLGKGVTPEGWTPGTKVPKGRKGDDATNSTVHPKANVDSRDGTTPGKEGWSAAKHPREMNGEDGQDGTQGKPGGGILLLCKELALVGSANRMNLSARGGQGGNGQKGQDGAEGGDGGEPFDAQDGKGFMSAGYQFSVPGGPGGSGGNGGRGGRAGAGGNGGFVIVYTEAPTHNLATSAKTGERGQPGDGGKLGEKGIGGRAAHGIRSGLVPGQPKLPDGQKGKQGDGGGPPQRDGSDGTIEVKSGEDLSPALLGTMSVRQLAMMADRVKAVYLGLGPEAAADRRAAVLDQLDWLKDLLKRVPSQNLEFPLARASVLEVMDAKANLEAGQDWFGNGPGYVPSVAVGELRDHLDRQLEVLASIEHVSQEYETARINQKDATVTLQSALRIGDEQLSAISSEFATTRRKLDETAKEIAKVEDRRKAARQPLEDALVGFSDKVQESFGLTAETLFNGLSQLAFTSPQHPGGAGLMVVSQVGLILNEGMKNILDDTGRPIEKGYVLGEVKSLSSPDLSTDLSHMGDGSFAVQATYRALAEYEKVKQLIKRFSTKGGAQDAIDQINQFIEIVRERNRHVDYYNELLQLLVQLNTLERKVHLRQQVSRDALSRSDPTLDEAAGYLSGLAERAKQECLQALYLLYRAQCFWSLEDLDGVLDLLGTSPVGIRHDQIKASKGRLDTRLTNSLERMRRTPNRFPKDDKNVGLAVVLTRETHGYIFDDLKLLNSARFRIAPATHRSPIPRGFPWAATKAVSPCDKMEKPDGPNPFYGKADVRLTKVRVWLIGFRTSAPRHSVTLQHLGSELFCTPNYKLYPSPDRGSDEADGKGPRIYHADLRVPFSYSPEGLWGAGELWEASKKQDIAGYTEGQKPSHPRLRASEDVSAYTELANACRTEALRRQHELHLLLAETITAVDDERSRKGAWRDPSTVVDPNARADLLQAAIQEFVPAVADAQRFLAEWSVMLLEKEPERERLKGLLANTSLRRLYDVTIRLFDHGVDRALGPNTAYRLPAVLAAIGAQVTVQAEARTGFHPGRLDVDGAEDGDLGFTGNLGLGIGSKECYAAVGPFADWLLTVREDHNPDADWSQCNTIVIDFHGFHQSFT